MAYKHVLVSDLKSASEHDLHTQEQARDWPHKIDGIPVRKEVLDMCLQLRRSYSGYRFHAGRGTSCRSPRTPRKPSRLPCPS